MLMWNILPNPEEVMVYCHQMNLQHALGSLRRYGLRGVFDFLLGHVRRGSFRRKMAATLITDPNWRPQPGMTIIGNMSYPGSLSKVLRDLVIRLKACGIPCQAFDTGCDVAIPRAEYADLLTPPSEFRLNRYTDIVGMSSLPPLPETGCRLSRIGFWEFESGLREGNPEFWEKTEAVVTSLFNLHVFRNLLPSDIPVTKILYPFQFKVRNAISPESIRVRYGLAPDDFVVFFNFDYASSYYRKNPEGVLKAFARALGDRADAKVVFKTMRAKACPRYAAQLHALATQLGIASRVVFVENFVPQDELVALTAACDAYISLHRGEGFGLGIAEAMKLGKPVIVTDYSAPTEFCNSENALLVPYSIVAVKDAERDVDVYRHVKTWAEPNLDAAAAALRRLYEDRDFARALGAKGQAFIDAYFSDEAFKKSIEGFLARQ